MKKHILSILILVLCSSYLFADDGVSFKVDIYQIEKSAETKHLIYTTTFDIMTSKTISGFVGPFSIDIDLLSADTMRASFNTHVITLGSSAHTYSKSFTAEYGLPARVEKIEGKNNSEYLLLVSPMEYKTETDLSCQYDHRNKKDFSVKPTAHTDIYYVPSTLSDFYWDSIKQLLESNFILFRNLLHLNIPGKSNILVSPCATNSVIWDNRFGTSVDPTKGTSYAVYNKEYTTVDPFILNHLLALKTYGYTAPFISEGLANYFSFGIYEMKSILKEKNNIPLVELLGAHAYVSADPSVADRISTTFSRYLIDAYSLTQYLEMYKKADDINLATTLQEVYKKPISELEQEWLTYVDTITIDKKSYLDFAQSSEMMLNYELTHTYYLSFFDVADSQYDSLVAYKALKRSAFFNGDFNSALAYQQKYIDIQEKPVAMDWMVKGAYSLMVGKNEDALANYTKALAIDSSNQVIKFNLALYYKINGDYSKAKEILMTNFSNIKGASAQGETRILLAEILALSENKTDKELSQKYYKQSIVLYTKAIQANNSSPAAYMWLGRSYLGINEYESAITNLQLARFIESRPFYYGMIDLLLAKAYKASGDNGKAKTYLNSVISSSTAAYHQQEAKEILKQFK